MNLKPNQKKLRPSSLYDPTHDFIYGRSEIETVHKYLNKVVEGEPMSNEINNECIILLKKAMDRLHRIYQSTNLLGIRNAELQMYNFRQSNEIKQLTEYISGK